MTTRTDTGSADPIIDSRDDLLATFASGEKPEADWRIGTEHEKFVYRLGDYRAPSYDEPGGIRDLLNALTRFGWRPVEEGGKVIAMSGPDGAISLEPAGQLELSGAPLKNLHETCAETGRHLQQVKQVGDELGIGFLGLGMWPDKARSDLPVMPKGRYKIMLNYMPKVGSLGLDMMLRTCTIQVNLDYASEADMAAKFRVGLALQPLAPPCSPARPSPKAAERVPLVPQPYLVRYRPRPHRHAAFRVRRRLRLRTLSRLRARCPDVLRLPRRALHRRRRPLLPRLHGWAPTELPGEKPRVADFKDHLSTIFPEVRLKNYLEMRGADGGKWARICALPALWVGLLYDRDALGAAWDAVKHWTLEERQQLRDAVPRDGLTARTRTARPSRSSAAASSTSPKRASRRGRASMRPATTRPASSPHCASS
jgi:glutamate--cysteine ligase